MNVLYASVSNTSDIISVAHSTSHTAAVSSATVIAKTTSLEVGDTIEISIGYVGNYGKIFSGYVKQVERTYPDNLYSITAQDTLVRAVDYFVASSNPDSPFSRQNISGEELVEDVLALAGITNYGYEVTNFIFAISSPVEVQLVSCYDFCKRIADILAWKLYADTDGKVWFVDRKPYPDGDSPSATISEANGIVLKEQYIKSDRDLRNRVVVYGADGITGTAQASSPYLPTGFYKTVVLSTTIIDSQSIADSSASYNLALLNRLTQSISIEIIGDHTINARDVITVVAPSLGLSSDDWYVYMCEHRWSSSGYITNLELRK